MLNRSGNRASRVFIHFRMRVCRVQGKLLCLLIMGEVLLGMANVAIVPDHMSVQVARFAPSAYYRYARAHNSACECIYVVFM